MKKSEIDMEAVIRNHWESAGRAPQKKEGSRPTARDYYLQLMIENFIVKYLYPGARLLDIGCGDAISTLKFAQVTGNATGVEASQSLHTLACENKTSHEDVDCRIIHDRVENLPELFKNSFDICVSIRCLINLADSKTQFRVIDYIHSILKPGGLFLCSEGFIHRWNKLNAYRVQAGLPEMKIVDYNRFFDDHEFESHVSEKFLIESYESIGTYLFLSRIFHPSLVSPDPPKHDSPINKTAFQIASSMTEDHFRDCSYTGVYVLRKKRESGDA